MSTRITISSKLPNWSRPIISPSMAKNMKGSKDFHRGEYNAVMAEAIL
jgi:hypothetical protein